MTSSPIFLRLPFFSCQVTGSGAMLIFVYKGLTRNPEIGILPSEFFPISGDWGKLEIPNLAPMSLIKRSRMLQNARVRAFTVSELLRETYPPPLIRVKYSHPLVTNA